MNRDELVIFETQGIKVTNLRAIIQNKTYAMSNITSVEMGEKPASGCMPTIFIVCGLGALVGFGLPLFSSFDTSHLVGTMSGAAIMGTGIYLIQISKPTFTIKIGSASGESNIMESGDKEMITKIVGAMNDAIIRRG